MPSKFLYDNFITDEDELTVSSEEGHIISTALKEGTGSATMATSGTYTGDDDRKYSIEIDSVAGGKEVGQATFKWRRDQGSWTTGVTTSSSPITLEDGVQVAWTGGTGDDFELADAWYFYAKVIYGKAKLIDNNRDTRYKSGALDDPNTITAQFGSSKLVEAICLYDHNLTEDATIEALFDGGGTNFVTNGFFDSGISSWSSECWDGANGSIAWGSGQGSKGGAMRVEVDVGSSDLVTNGGFTSDTTGWTGVDATLSSVVGGQSGNCLKIERTGGTEQSAKTTSGITVVAYKKYRCKFYVKIDSGQESAFKVVLGNSDASVVYSELEGTANTTWTLYTLDYEGVNTTSVYIHLIRDSGEVGYINYDTVQLYLVSDIWTSAKQSIGSLTIGDYYRLTFVVKDGDSEQDDWIARIGNYSLFGTTSDEYVQYEMVFKANTTSMPLYLSKFSGIQGYILFDEVQIYATEERVMYPDWDRSPSEVLANSQFLDCNANHRVTGWEVIENEDEGVISTYDDADNDSDKLFMKQGSSTASNLEVRSSFEIVANRVYTLSVDLTSTASLCTVKIGTTQGGTDILNITTLGTGTYNWAFTTATELLYISLIDGNATSGKSEWASVEIAEMYENWRNPSFDYGTWDQYWTKDAGGLGGTITQDVGKDYRAKFTQGGTSYNMHMKQSIVGVASKQHEIRVNLNNASSTYTDCYLQVSTSASETDPTSPSAFSILVYQFTGAGEVILRFKQPSSPTGIVIYIWDTQPASATSLWEYVELRETLLVVNFGQTLGSNLISNGDFSAGWNADIINDDMQDDDTGDWTKVNCNLTFSTNHYNFAPTTTGQCYFYQTKTITANKQYVFRVEHKLSSGSVSYVLWCRIKVGGTTYNLYETVESDSNWRTFILPIRLSKGGSAEIGVNLLNSPDGSPVIDLRALTFREYDNTEITNWTRKSLESGDVFTYSTCFAKPNAIGVTSGITAYRMDQGVYQHYDAEISQTVSVSADTNYLLKIQKGTTANKTTANIRIKIEFNNGVDDIEDTIWSSTTSADTYEFLFSTFDATQIILYIKLDEGDDSCYELEEVFLYEVTFDNNSDPTFIHQTSNTPRIFVNSSDRMQINHAPDASNTVGRIVYQAHDLTIGNAYEVELNVQSTDVDNIKVIVATTLTGSDVATTSKVNSAGTFKFYFIATATSHYISAIRSKGDSDEETQINSVSGKESSAHGYESISNNASCYVELIEDGLYSNCFHLVNGASSIGKIEIKKTWTPAFTLDVMHRLTVVVKSGDIDDSFLLELRKADSIIETISGTTTEDWVYYTVDFVPSENIEHSITVRKNSTSEGYIMVDQITITELEFIREIIPWQENKILHFLSGVFETRNVTIIINDSGNPDSYIEISELVMGSIFEPSRALQHGYRDEKKILSTTIKNTFEVEKRKFRNITNELVNLRYKALTTTDKDGFETMLEAISDKTTGKILPVFFTPDTNNADEFRLINITDIKFQVMPTPNTLYEVTIICKEELTSV